MSLDEKIFVEKFRILAKHYNYETQPAIAKIYYEYLKQSFNTQEFLEVMKMSVLQIPTRMGLPSAQELVELMKGSRSAQGIIDWQTILRAAAANDPQMLSYLSDRAHIALSAIGGLAAVGITENSKLEWLQKDFLAVYSQSAALDAKMLKPAARKPEPQKPPEPSISPEQWAQLKSQMKTIGR